MTFETLVETMNLAKRPPEKMAAFYDDKDFTPACDLSLIDELQREYTLFGDYYDVVRSCAVLCNADPVRSAWVRTAVAFVKAVPFDEVKAVPVPKPDDTQLTAMLPLYIIISQMPIAKAEYLRRGFSEEEIRKLFTVVEDSLCKVEDRTGMVGINAMFYVWTMHFAKAQIFNAGSLQFETRRMPDRAVYLQHKKTGEYRPIVCDGTYHRSGMQMIWAPGYTDAEGSFDCTYSEDDAYFYGHGVVNGVVTATPEKYSKTEWECVLRPGDPCIGVHIPKGADISPETVDFSIAEAKRILKERFPEFQGKYFYCASWMLDPMLCTLLGDNAKLSLFQRRYVCLPEWSNGLQLLGFVFPARFNSYEEWPEDTRLQRQIKQLYLDGKGIYYYSGVIF